MSGARAHTARPYTGRNAIHRLGDVITKVANYEPRATMIDDIEFIEQLQVVDISGGVAPNVVPDRALCTINHRFAPIDPRTRRSSGSLIISAASPKPATLFD